jgi:hypothetical protein
MANENFDHSIDDSEGNPIDVTIGLNDENVSALIMDDAGMRGAVVEVLEMGVIVRVYTAGSTEPLMISLPSTGGYNIDESLIEEQKAATAAA